MHLTITGRNFTLTQPLKTYATEKVMALFARLATAPQVAQALHVDIEMIRETQHHRKGEIWKAAVTITLPQQKRPLHASAVHNDIYAAVDLLIEEIEREMQTYKGRFVALLRRSGRTIKRLLRVDLGAAFPKLDRERNEGN